MVPDADCTQQTVAQMYPPWEGGPLMLRSASTAYARFTFDYLPLTCERREFETSLRPQMQKTLSTQAE